MYINHYRTVLPIRANTYYILTTCRHHANYPTYITYIYQLNTIIISLLTDEKTKALKGSVSCMGHSVEQLWIKILKLSDFIESGL